MPARQLRRLRPGRLAWKLAAYSVLLALLPALLVGLHVAQPWLRLGLLLLIFGVSVFVAASYLIMPRLALARELLRQIRRRSFENLELAHVPQGDELNSLIWQVYRTGRTLEKEIEELKRMENYRREF